MTHFRNLFAIYCAVIGLFGSALWASVAWSKPSIVPYYGWNCESSGGPSGVRVNVSYAQGAYIIQVVTPEFSREFSEAKLEQKVAELTYLGSDGSQLAMLNIAQEPSGELGNWHPGRLTLGDSIDLSCYPTR